MFIMTGCKMGINRKLCFSKPPEELLEEVAPRFLSHHVFEKLRGFEGVNLSTAIDAEEMVDWTGACLVHQRHLSHVSPR